MSAASPETDTELTPLTRPADGLSEVVETPAALDEVVAAFAAATGPVAVDAERASGFRYGQHAYLVQLRRTGAGTALVDRRALPADGLSEGVEAPGAPDEVVAALAAATGPVAVDGERASGFRYRQHAYLVQLRRPGGGTALVDPQALPDLHALNEALAGSEW